MRIVLVTRRGCHLCDEALGHLRELGYEPELADVDADPELFRLYDWRVPVVLVEGRPLIEGHIVKEALRAALEGSGRGRKPA